MVPGRCPMVAMRSVVMHSGLDRQVAHRPIMFRATVNSRSVRELDAEQENHLQQRGGTDEHIAKAVHTRRNNTFSR